MRLLMVGAGNMGGAMLRRWLAFGVVLLVALDLISDAMRKSKEGK